MSHVTSKNIIKVFYSQLFFEIEDRYYSALLTFGLEIMFHKLMNACHSIAQRGLNNELNFTFLDQLKIKFHKHYNIIQYPYTCMCMYNTLIHVCVCTIPLYMYMYNTLIHVCICTIPLYMYVYVQYPYTCMCMYNTLIHVCVCTIPLYMYGYVQYPYTCMYMYNTLIHVCVCTIPLYMYMYNTLIHVYVQYPYTCMYMYIIILCSNL